MTEFASLHTQSFVKLLFLYMKNLSSYLTNRIRGNASARILLFDVDDTLVHTSARIWIRRPDGTEFSLSNAEYNTYKFRPGEEADYREFNDPAILDNDIPTSYLATLKREYAKGTHIGILTARSDTKLIKSFLMKKGIEIKDELVFAISDPKLGLYGTIQQRKAYVIKSLIKAGYKTLVFFDDCKDNLEAAKKLQRDDVRIVTVKC